MIDQLILIWYAKQTFFFLTLLNKFQSIGVFYLGVKDVGDRQLECIFYLP